MSAPKMTKDEWFVLEWLSKEDSSAYGEAKGSELDRLIDLGIAEVGPMQPNYPNDKDYCRVFLTDYGWEVVVDARDATAEATDVAEASWQ